MVYSPDAYNNVQERCEKDYGGGPAQRCTEWTYVPDYVDPPVHLRGLVKTEAVGTGSGTGIPGAGADPLYV